MTNNTCKNYHLMLDIVHYDCADSHPGDIRSTIQDINVLIEQSNTLTQWTVDLNTNLSTKQSLSMLTQLNNT